jgi:hypothetical protein
VLTDKSGAWPEGTIYTHDADVVLWAIISVTMASAAVDQSTGGHTTTFEPLTTVQTGVTKHHVRTILNYHKPNEDGSPPHATYVGKPETYERPVDPVEVTINDIRGETDKYNLDSNGFQLYNFPSAEKDFLDDDKIKAEYYPETERLLKEAFVHP